MQRITGKDTPAGLYQVVAAVESYLSKSGLEHSLVLLIKMRASQINQCGYCLDMHSKDAIAEGETVQRLVSLEAWRETSYYTPRERAALALTEALTELALKPQLDPVFEEAEEHFTKPELALLTVAIAQINTWNRIARSFGYTPGSYVPAGVKA